MQIEETGGAVPRKTKGREKKVDRQVTWKERRRSRLLIGRERGRKSGNKKPEWQRRVWRQEEWKCEKKNRLKLRLSHWFKKSDSEWTLEREPDFAVYTQRNCREGECEQSPYVSACCMKAMNHSPAYPEEYSYALEVFSHI